MLASSRENCSGIQLEVNEKILDSCNQLMKVMSPGSYCSNGFSGYFDLRVPDSDFY
jgi:hypothetical protein